MMKATIVVHLEHLGGPCELIMAAELEPNKEAFNHATYLAMAEGINDMLATVMSVRDRIRYVEEQDALRLGAEDEDAKPPKKS